MKKIFILLSTFGALSMISCSQSDATAEDNINAVEQSESLADKLDKSTYKIITTKHYPTTENFYVLLKKKITNADSLQNFVDRFREQHCKKQCNIYLYDDSSIERYVAISPLPDKEYLLVADHFIAESGFTDNTVFPYPFQDIKYKELGGTNWKKEPIK